MHNTKAIKRFVYVFSALTLCNWTTVAICADAPAKDDYQVIIRKGEGDLLLLSYTFAKTNITGGTVYPNPDRSFAVATVISGEEISFEQFPALKRSETLSERASKYTRLFVSNDSDALMAVLQNKATPEQKKLVFSARVPQKAGGYCTGKLYFTVNEKSGKLSIKPNDQRTCMRSGSEKAKESRTIAKQERQKAAQKTKEEKEALEQEKRQAQAQVAAAQKEVQELEKRTKQAEAAASAAVRDLGEAKRSERMVYTTGQVQVQQEVVRAAELKAQVEEAERKVAAAELEVKKAKEAQELAEQRLKEERKKSVGTKMKEKAKELVSGKNPAEPQYFTPEVK